MAVDSASALETSAWSWHPAWWAWGTILVKMCELKASGGICRWGLPAWVALPLQGALGPGVA